MGLNPGEKRESPVLLAGACSGRRHFFPQNWGKNHIWKEIPNLGIVYSQCFYAENMAGKLKENYDAKFLEAIDFAFSMMFKFHCKSKLSNEGHDCGSQTSPSKTCMCIKNISQR